VIQTYFTAPEIRLLRYVFEERVTHCMQEYSTSADISAIPQPPNNCSGPAYWLQGQGACDVDALPRAEARQNASLLVWEEAKAVAAAEKVASEPQLASFRLMLDVFTALFLLVPLATYGVTEAVRRKRGTPEAAARPRSWRETPVTTRLIGVLLGLSFLVITVLVFTFGEALREAGDTASHVFCVLLAALFAVLGIQATAPPTAYRKKRGRKKSRKTTLAALQAESMAPAVLVQGISTLNMYKAPISYDGSHYALKLAAMEILEALLQVGNLIALAPELSVRTVLGTGSAVSLNMIITPLLLMHPNPFVHRCNPLIALSFHSLIMAGMWPHSQISCRTYS
jgi:hypothetical protein